ncbi:MAG: hypothetical protein JKY33_07305 [Bacteroidia bacterium]|nr:hypothetical protein [Bacteroidia bacterium]
MKLVLTTDNTQSLRTKIQLSSLIEHNILPDTILLHHAGLMNGLIMRYENYRKIFRDYRFFGIGEIIKRKITPKANNYANGYNFPNYLTDKRIQEVNNLLKKVKIYHCRKINHNSTINLLLNLRPDLVVCNSGLIGKRVIDTGINFLNIHTSKLPDYRGMNNIEWALWHDEPIWCTVHKIAKEIDAGDILYQEKISNESDYEMLNKIDEFREYYFQKSYALIGKVVKKYVEGNINFVLQKNKNEPLGQYYVMHYALKEMLQQKLEIRKKQSS